MTTFLWVITSIYGFLGVMFCATVVLLNIQEEREKGVKKSAWRRLKGWLLFPFSVMLIVAFWPAILTAGFLKSAIDAGKLKK